MRRRPSRRFSCRRSEVRNVGWCDPLVGEDNRVALNRVVYPTKCQAKGLSIIALHGTTVAFITLWPAVMKHFAIWALNYPVLVIDSLDSLKRGALGLEFFGRIQRQ